MTASIEAIVLPGRLPRRSPDVAVAGARACAGAMMLQGACHCGSCRYVLDVDTLDDVANCHCTVCRRTTGATLVTWATLPLAKFRWSAGTPAQYRSSAPALRYFCANCGAQLAFEHADWPGTIDITTATLEHPERFPPTRHIWMTTHLPWMPLGDLAGEDGES